MDPLQRDMEEVLITVISNIVFMLLIISFLLPLIQKSKIISKTFINIM